jgi:hypothetical protein
VRWHGLLRQAGVRLGLTDSLLLNTAGQAITAVLPLGDLTRAILASRAAQAEFGAVAATVTVQELAYSLVLMVSAAPVLIRTRHGVWILLAVLAGILIVLALLTVGRPFYLVHRLVARTPLLRRLLGQIEGLHQETAVLLHRPETVTWSVLDAARAAAGISIVWLIVEGLNPGVLGWWQAAFVLSLSSLGRARRARSGCCCSSSSAPCWSCRRRSPARGWPEVTARDWPALRSIAAGTGRKPDVGTTPPRV